MSAPKEEYVKYFPFQDVYVNDKKYWSFKEHRKYSNEWSEGRSGSNMEMDTAVKPNGYIYTGNSLIC